MQDYNCVPRSPKNDENGEKNAAAAYAPVVDLLVKSSATLNYIPEFQAIAGDSSATTLYRAAGAEYDLRLLGDAPADGGFDGGLLADVLAESVMDDNYGLLAVV